MSYFDQLQFMSSTTQVQLKSILHFTRLELELYWSYTGVEQNRTHT